MAAQKLETCNSKIKPVISLLLRHLTVKRKKRQKRYNQFMWRSTAALPRMQLVDAKVSTVLCFIRKLSLKSTMWWSVIHLSHILDSAVGLFKQPSLMQHVSTFDNEKLGLFRNWTVAEALQCMHAGRRCWEKAVYRHRSGEKTVGSKRTVFTIPWGCLWAAGIFST